MNKRDQKPWYKQLHWQIIIGMILGLIYGLIASYLGWGDFTKKWIKPFGTIFINLLKMIAVPMIISSLIVGVASLSDLTKLSRIGGKTIALYIGTTVLAIIIGLVLVNVFKPGKVLPKNIKQDLKRQYVENINKAESDEIAKSSETVKKKKEAGPLDTLVGIVPKNAIDSMSDNTNMLQVVFISLLVGIGIVKAGVEKTETLLNFFKSVYEVVLQIVNIIMMMAPLGVFAQISGVLTDLAGKNPLQALNILKALGFYLFVVLLGMVIHVTGVYTTLLKLWTKIGVGRFFKAIQEAQLIAFSTSSSSATLPVTMKCCEENLDIPEEVCSFTLPVGATINMDGTSLFQAVSAVFLAQIIDMDPTLWQQVIIVLTGTLASIGTAGVPGAGIVMLIIVMQAINVPIAGIALIMGVERIIDMFRTVANITGDAAVTAVVAETEKIDKEKTPPSEE